MLGEKFPLKMIGTRKTRDRIRGYYRKIRESKRATPKYLINWKKIFEVEIVFEKGAFKVKVD